MVFESYFGFNIKHSGARIWMSDYNLKEQKQKDMGRDREKQSKKLQKIITNKHTYVITIFSSPTKTEYTDLLVS